MQFIRFSGLCKISLLSLLALMVVSAQASAQLINVRVENKAMTWQQANKICHSTQSRKKWRLPRLSEVIPVLTEISQAESPVSFTTPADAEKKIHLMWVQDDQSVGSNPFQSPSEVVTLTDGEGDDFTSFDLNSDLQKLGNALKAHTGSKTPELKRAEALYRSLQSGLTTLCVPAK